MKHLIMAAFLFSFSTFSQADNLIEDEKNNPVQILQRALSTETETDVRIQILKTIKDFISSQRRLQDDVYAIAQNITEEQSVRLEAIRTLSWLPVDRKHENFFRELILNNRESTVIRTFAVKASYSVAANSQNFSNFLLSCVRDQTLPTDLRASCTFAVSHSGRQTEVARTFIELLTSRETPAALKTEILRTSYQFVAISQFKNFIFNYISAPQTEMDQKLAALKLVRFFQGDSRSRNFLSQLTRSSDELIRSAAFDVYRTELSEVDVEWFRLTKWPGSQNRRDPL